MRAAERSAMNAHAGRRAAATSSLQRRTRCARSPNGSLLKATAVFLAIVLWFVVNAKEPQIELVPVRFQPVLLDSSLVLRDPLPQFQAIVAGSPKELIKLNSTPPVIRRQITADAPDTLVLDLRPDDVIAARRGRRRRARRAAAEPHAALRVDVDAHGAASTRRPSTS